METLAHITDRAARTPRPIRVVQFGEGNFLRAFVDHMIDIANEQGVFHGDVAVVKPIPMGSLEAFHAQDNLYTVCLRGKQNGRAVEESRIVTCISRVVDAYGEGEPWLELAELPELEVVVSNTTEAGIVFDPEDRMSLTPPASFPGKLTKFLHHRYHHFGGAADQGVILLPVELIERNGEKLRECVASFAKKEGLEPGFLAWLEESCVFCSTLVDRIVTGYPGEEAEEIQEKLGYRDRLLTVAEPFGLWVIQSPQNALGGFGPRDIAGRFPLDRAGLPVVFTRDLTPYRERKVRILNGAHTATVPAAFLAGLDTVGQCMAHPGIRGFLTAAVEQEILPTVPLPREEAASFALSTYERFENPFVRHQLLSITLNSVSKWRARILPSLLDYLEATGTLPRRLAFTFAALLAFYSGGRMEQGKLVGSRNGQDYPILDEGPVLEFFGEQGSLSKEGPDSLEFVSLCCARADFWGRDLNGIPGFVPLVAEMLRAIRADGAEAAMDRIREGTL